MGTQKSEYDRRKNNGLCVQCEEPREDQKKARCIKCLAKNKECRANKRASRKADGHCTECPNQAEPGKSLCKDCSDAHAVSAKERYNANKAARRCRQCGEDSGGFARCTTCRKKFQAWRKRHAKELRKDSHG